MPVSHFIVAIVGDTVGFNHTHTINKNPVADKYCRSQCADSAHLHIYFLLRLNLPGAWVVIGEILPVTTHLRASDITLSTASNN